MSKRRIIVIALLGVSALGTAAQADMMALSPSGSGCRQLPPAPAAAAVPAENPSALFEGGTISDIPALPVRPAAAADGDDGQVGGTRNVPILTDGQNSFHLCLYALLGLGLCKSVPLVKKMSFGYVPQWYHDGGPVQVGHSFAISPDCLCAAPVCFVQPDSPAENPIPQYHFPGVVSRWRNSQFAPAVLASRGPPACSR